MQQFNLRCCTRDENGPNTYKMFVAGIEHMMIEVARCFQIQGYRCELFTFKISCKMWQNDIYSMLNWVFKNSMRRYICNCVGRENERLDMAEL